MNIFQKIKLINRISKTIKEIKKYLNGVHVGDEIKEAIENIKKDIEKISKIVPEVKEIVEELKELWEKNK